MADNNVLDAITLHHFRNIADGTGKTVKKTGADGREYDIHHTVYTAQVDIGGVPTLIPTVWDGEVLPVKDALEKALEAAESGTEWPTAKTHKALREFDKSIHEKYMVDSITPKEAKEILKFQNLSKWPHADDIVPNWKTSKVMNKRSKSKRRSQSSGGKTKPYFL
jgi:hypothetical protein